MKQQYPFARLCRERERERERDHIRVKVVLKVAPYSFSAREEWELNWHKRAREERDSPSQMTCVNQPPGRTFPKSD